MEDEWKPLVEAEGPFAGWTTWRDIDPFEGRAGPFYYRREDDGEMRAAFLVESKHLNVGGFVHGGCLMTFADFALFAIALPHLDDPMAVTVSLNTEFLDRVVEGDRVEATGRMLRRTRSLAFIQGVASVGERPVLAFSGVIRPMARPLPAGPASA